MMQRGLWFI